VSTFSIPDLEQTVDVLRAVGGALRLQEETKHLTAAESLAAAGGFLSSALMGKATAGDVDRMANNIQDFTQGLRAGLAARKEGEMVPWGDVKKELGISDQPPVEDTGLAEVAAKAGVPVDEHGWPESIWDGIGGSPEERLAYLRGIIETALKEGADPYVQVGRQLLWPDLDPVVSDETWLALHPLMRQHAKEFCYGADYGGEITGLVGEPLTAATEPDTAPEPDTEPGKTEEKPDTEPDPKPGKKAKKPKKATTTRRLHRAAR